MSSSPMSGHVSRWVECLGGPDDGEMAELPANDNGQLTHWYTIRDEGYTEGIYRPDGRAVESLPVVRMIWRHVLPR